MNFSLIQVTDREDGKIEGIWVQDHVGGTLESATQRAIATEAANGNRFDIAVVERIPFEGGPYYDKLHGLTRLDTQRISC